MNSKNKTQKTITIDLELTGQQAVDLAQLIKRLNFSDVYGCATNEDEAYNMLQALAKVQDALARHGYNPR